MRNPYWLIAVAVVAIPASAQQIWTGHSAGTTIVWTAKNIRAYRTTSKYPVFNLYSYLLASFKNETADPRDIYVNAEDAVSIESLVGHILSIRDENYLEIGREERQTRLLAFDLQRSVPTKPASLKLTDIFPPNAIFAALMSEKRLHAALPKGSAPTDLSSLLKILGDQPIKDGTCQYAVTTDFLQSFAIYDYANGFATVRLGLSNFLQVCLGDMLEMDIQLEVPSSQRAGFEAAQRKKEGFLMKDRGIVATEDAKTEIAFTEHHLTSRKAR